MAFVYSMIGEAKIASPAGHINLALTQDGHVMVEASVPRGKPRWFVDQLKAAREFIRFGRRALGFSVTGSEPLENKAWFLKMFEGAEDAYKQRENELLRRTQRPGHVRLPLKRRVIRR